MDNRLILLNPGPVNTSVRVQQALLKGDLCHREPEFSEMMARIRKKLLTAFDAENEYKAVLISGSGTAALEMAVSSCLDPDRTLLIIDNGVYGRRMAKMAEAYRLKHIVLEYPWGTPPDLKEVEQALRNHHEIEVVAMVHHETTSGLLNPLAEIFQIAQRHQKKLLADCISSLAGDSLDFKETPVDFCVGTANKCIQGFPGVSFVLAREPELHRLAPLPARSVYFNLYENFKAQEQGNTLFTPAIQSHYACEEALDELIEESVPSRVARYRKAADLLRDGFKQMGLKFIVPESLHSNTLTSLELPAGITYEELHDRLRKKGYVIYQGQGKFSKSIFRVANMGDITLEEFQEFLAALKESLVN